MKLFKMLTSLKMSILLLFIFAVAIGWATIIENDFGTQSARAVVYASLWFEVLLVWLTFNLIVTIFQMRMYRKGKWLVLLFHTSFVVIMIGATITRYIGYEGIMHIREGASSNTILSQYPYLDIKLHANGKEETLTEQLMLSRLSSNSFEKSLNVDGKNVNVKLLEFIPQASHSLVEDPEGVPYLSLVISDEQGPKNINLKQGEYIVTKSTVIDFGSNEKFGKDTISITMSGDKLTMSHDKVLDILSMDTRESSQVKPASDTEFQKRHLYRLGEVNIVLRDFYKSAVKKVVSNPSKKAKSLDDALHFQVSVDGKSQELTIFGKSGRESLGERLNINGVEMMISYGALRYEIPFSLELVDFQLDRYAGSMSPSSYASEVILKDSEMGIERPVRIYMNHVLEHRGFRFFQSSFDQDELGTILSVNHDPGTLPTYIGYFMLAIGMFLSLFQPNNRFLKLREKARKLQGVAPVLVAFLLSTNISYGADIADEFIIDKEHARKFSELLSQHNGRLKPINTLSREMLNKVHRSDTLFGLDANQVTLGMMTKPFFWRKVKMIKVSHDGVKKLIGMAKEEKYATFEQFFEDPERMSMYRLGKAAEETARTPASQRGTFEKELLKVDERVNVAYMVYSGSLFNLFPDSSSLDFKWLSTVQALQTFDESRALEVRQLVLDYFNSLDISAKSKDWSSADSAVAAIAQYQKTNGSAIYPDSSKIEAELAYNDLDLFENLTPLYLIVGFILLALSLYSIVFGKGSLKVVMKMTSLALIIFFFIHTFGLALRWYISGHAPWSDAYESLVYIGWATVLAGFIFSKNSPMTLAATSILAGLILFVAHLNWLDPQITNLVPVLKSYWLNIHVSMITGSYGFLGLGALLGFISLILFALKNSENQQRLERSILELTYLAEMSLMLGLALLTVGNFLGGVWANESWGRYWGWDPKETWALVTILVYAVVLHLRFIKSIYSIFLFNVVALLSFSSVIMTYFGVNFYLSGLHSYAQGDPVPIPVFVYYSIAIITLLIGIAWRNREINSPA